MLIFAPETTHHELNRINETTTLPLPALTGSYNALCADAVFGKHDDEPRQREDATVHDHPLAQLPNRVGECTHVQEQCKPQHPHPPQPRGQHPQ